MKMNNKGFAISVILYAMVILIMGIMYLLLDVLNDRYKLSKEANNNVVEYINNQGVNTLSEVYTNKLATNKLIKTGQLTYHSFGNYYYTDNNPNNYVRFNNELWRIIGVITIDKVKYVKIIDYNNAIEMTSNNHKIIDSNIFTYLNEDYYDTMDSSKNMIGKVNWFNNALSTNMTPLNAYNVENNGNVSLNRIGLINASDFGFTATETYYSNTLNNYAPSINNNWLSLTRNYFTMSYNGVNINIVNESGNLVSTSNMKAYVYPCAYLKKDTIIINGTGLETDPYILSTT